MFKINKKLQNTKIILCLILFFIYTAPSFAKIGGSSLHEEEVFEPTAPESPSESQDPTAAPINDYIYVLSFMGLGLGVFKIQEQKNK